MICQHCRIFLIQSLLIVTMFNASIFEKLVLGGMVTSTTVFALYSIFKDPEVKKQDAFKVRQELLEKRNVKMLYSTMSFFYLLGFKSKDPQSFITMQNILNIETPQIVAVPISKEDYENKYEKALTHPRFRQAMDRFKFNVKNKRLDQIQNVKDFHLKNLQILYLIDYCISLKNCKVVYARRDSTTYERLDELYHSKQQKNKNISTDSTRSKIQDYTDILIQQMKPTIKFAISPQSPFKHIVGIIQPELFEGVSRRWKEKFKQNYSHIVMEDEEVLEKHAEERKKEDEFKSKFEVQDKNKQK